MEKTVIMTGGYPSRSRVQEYDLVGATDRDLPDLIKGRQDHACGHYVHNGKTVIIRVIVSTATKTFANLFHYIALKRLLCTSFAIVTCRHLIFSAERPIDMPNKL